MSSLAEEEQVLIETAKLPDKYILDKIVQASKGEQQQQKQAGRVFIMPSLQLNVVNYREDEDVFKGLLAFFSRADNNLTKLKLATGYFNL